MKVGIITKEWPPHIYGGAGVHVKYLTASLSKHIECDVHCFGEERVDATGHEVPQQFQHLNPALSAMAIDLEIAQSLENADIFHSHTWYANFAGHIGGLFHNKPHVLTAHSLEPDRPWKMEQIGGGYRVSSWIEKTAYESADAIIAVSNGMARDIKKAYPSVDPEKIHTIYNGINTSHYFPQSSPTFLMEHGIDTPYALFVGRITRQKGLRHLLEAWKSVDPQFGLVIAAGNPDEPEIGREVAEAIAELQKTRSNVHWFEKMLPHDQVVALYSDAALFVCPSIYEPLGIVNLEAMACQTAVLASDVGGIPEVVQDGVTGELIHYSGDASDFEKQWSKKINSLMSNPEKLDSYGIAGRKRAVGDFSWDAIALQTIELYQSVIAKHSQ